MQPIAAISLTAPTWSSASPAPVATPADRFAPEPQDGFWTGLKALSLAAITTTSALWPSGAEAAPPEETHQRVGEYTLHLRPADIDLNPRWHDNKPGLRLKGVWLDSELSRQVGDSTYGLRGRLQGAATTYGDNNASANVEAFRRWEGKLSDHPAMFEVSSGAYRDLLHSTTSLGVQLRQEVKGGSFTWLGQPLSWALDGRQSYSVRVQGDDGQPGRQFHYSMLVGVQRDFQTHLLGRDATLSLTVGPELRGDQDTSAHLAPKIKARVRF